MIVRISKILTIFSMSIFTLRLNSIMINILIRTTPRRQDAALTVSFLAVTVGWYMLYNQSLKCWWSTNIYWLLCCRSSWLLPREDAFDSPLQGALTEVAVKTIVSFQFFGRCLNLWASTCFCKIYNYALTSQRHNAPHSWSTGKLARGTLKQQNYTINRCTRRSPT